MSQYNLFRASIYHCTESDRVIEAVYIPDGIMVVDSDSGKVLDVGEYSTTTPKWPNPLSLKHFNRGNNNLNYSISLCASAESKQSSI